MKICILSRNPRLYSTYRLVQAADARGHEVEVLDTLRCTMNVATHRPRVRYGGEELPMYDAVIPRIGASITFYGLAVLRQFEMMDVFAMNESAAIGRARDKLRCLQVLAREGIGLPVTGFASAPDDIQDVIRMVGGAPLVVKLLEGTQGVGVVLAETQNAAESVLEAFLSLQHNIMVQEYVREAGGADIRCFVVDGEVVASMKRQAREGEFRANLHRGGQATAIEISETERQTAIAATQALGLNVAGVDLLRSSRGPLVLEVNASPGLEGIEHATGVDIAERMIQFLERRACATQPRPKPQG